MRPACVLCCLKHLAQAQVLLLEARKGYPDHFWLALGHLAEAEDEIMGRGEEFSTAIRNERKELESNPQYAIDFSGLRLAIAAATGFDVSKFLGGPQ